MSVKNVDVRTAFEMQSRDGCAYVDVRSVPEYDSGHAQGAHNVPLLHRDPATGQMRPNPDFLAVMQANYPPDAKLLVGCQMGGRSARATEILASAGYRDVSNVQGGYGGARDPRTGQRVAEGWVEAGLPVEQSAPAGGSYEELRRKVS